MRITIKHIIIINSEISTMSDPHFGSIYYGADVDYTIEKDGLILNGTYRLSNDELSDLNRLLDKLEVKIKAQFSK